MKTVRKFSTFEDLKSCEDRLLKSAVSLEKHNNFKKVILDIRAIKIVQDQKRKSN